MSAKLVVIDGVTYVPATRAVAGIDDVMQALWESYMGTGERWNDGTNAQQAWMQVNEDEEGDSFEELAARIAKVVSR